MSNYPSTRRQGIHLQATEKWGTQEELGQPKWSAWRDGAVLVGIPALTLVDLLLRSSGSAALMAAACMTFLWKYVHRASAAVQRTSLALLGITAFLVPVIQQPVEALEKGLRIGALIASLLISVSLLSRASLRVPRMRKVVQDIFALPRRQRPLAIGVATQFLGGFLGLAGLTMMMEVASTREGIAQSDQLADFNAISRGYAALSLWSPMYSNMSIVLALYGGMHWIDVLPYALMIALVFIGLGVIQEKLKLRDEEGTPIPTSSVFPLLRDGWPIVIVMLCFVALMVLTGQYLKVAISVVIIAGSPLVAWLLNIMYPDEQARPLVNGSRKLAQDLLGQGLMAGEVLLFIASGCAGAVLSQAIPASWSASIAQLALGSPYLGSLLVIASIVLLSGTSIHPMLSAVLVASTLTASQLNLLPLVHLCAVLVGWGLAIIVTPFSVISIMAARFSGLPILDISLKSNFAFVLWSVAGATFVLGLANTL